MCCSRRAGKSHGIAYKAFLVAFEHPGCTMPYVTLTRETAKGIIWPALRDISRQTGVELSFKQNTGDVVWPNGSRLVMRGCENEKEGEKLRGMKYPVVFIDEAQAFPSHLKPFIEDVVEAATMDYSGQVYVTGTPNAACAGVFYDMCHGENGMSGWAMHGWVMTENEGLRAHMAKAGDSPEGWLARKREQKKWTKEHPTYMREYRGIWVRDTEGQVYAFAEDLNLIDATFEEALSGADDWEYVLGIDLGFKDPTAFVVLATSPTTGRCVVLETHLEKGLLAADIAVKVHQYEQRWNLSRVVVDTGGYGKSIAEELKRNHGVMCIAAEKQKKAAYIESLNSDLQAGVLQIVKHGNRPLIDELILLQWDEDSMRTGKPKEDPRYSNHLCDALLYAWRECAHHSDDWVEAEPEIGTKAWHAKEVQSIWDKIRADIREEQEKPWYL